MSPYADKLRELLEDRDIAGFLEAYEQYQQGSKHEPVITGLTQRILPAVLRHAFDSDRLNAAAVVQLWRLALNGRLLLVENDLIQAINLRIDDALAQVDPATTLPAPKLHTFDDLKKSDKRQRTVETTTSRSAAPAVEVKRVVIASAFSFGVWSAADTFDFRKNLCASRQEHEFLYAVRQYFPSLRAYPNVPMTSFIEFDKLDSYAPARARSFARLAQVDVLLCTEDEDPVAAIELDSVHHDGADAIERDGLKNLLFQLAGLPLFRIRADETKAVRAEDFFDLLMAEAKTLDFLRPRRLRPRQSRDFLVPAEVESRSVFL